MPKDAITPDDVARKIRELTKAGVDKVTSGARGNLTQPVSPGGQQPAEQTALRNPMNALGDLIWGGINGAVRRLPIGQPGQFLKVFTGSDGDRPGWRSLEAADVTDFAAEVQDLIDASAHDPVTVTDSTSVNLTLTGQDISAAAIFGTTAGTVAEGDHVHGGAGAVDSVNGQTGVVVLDADDIDDAATTNKWATAAELTKLAGIEALADVTDATNVEAAGAVMEADTTTASMQFVIDEDSMASDLATKVPTQQSVKAYVDAQVGGVGGGAPTDATYIVQTAHAGLSAEQALSALTTGLVKVTTGTGVLSTAAAADLPTGIDAAKIADGSVSNTEFQHISTVTSNVQTQIDALTGGGYSSAFPIGYATGRYYSHTAFLPNTGAITAQAMVANRLYAMPLIVPASVTFDRVAINLTTAVAGSTIRIGIYEADNGWTCTRIVDFGTLASTTPTGIKEITISQALSAGRYLVAIASSHTPSISRASMTNFNPFGETTVAQTNAGAVIQNLAGGFAALPDPLVATATDTSYFSVWFRVA